MDAALTNYTVIKKEMLALLYDFEKFRSFVGGSKVVVYSVHTTIRNLYNQKDTKFGGLCYCKSLTCRSWIEEVLKIRLGINCPGGECVTCGKENSDSRKDT